MEEDELKPFPFSLAVIMAFYGFMTFISILGVSEQYILFSIVLTPPISTFVIVAETTVLLYITIGLLRQNPSVRTVLAYYNIFVITDILFTLAFIDKEKLLALLKTAHDVENYAVVNLLFCFILYFILRFVKLHKEYFYEKME